MRYYIIAGERSGDLHAGNLVREIKKLDADAHFKGVGGDYMRGAGVELTVHYGELAFMGFLEVVRNFGTIARYRRKCKEDILHYKPDVLILIDYGGFNMLMASFAKKNGLKVFYYITPKVWAWYRRRALRLKKTVDRMFVILPFEKDFFAGYQCEVDYVGNPVLDAVKAHQPDPGFRKKHAIAEGETVVALLPGSRRQEVMRMAPVMAGVVRRFPQVRFAVATVNDLQPDLYHTFLQDRNVTLVKEDTYNLLNHAQAAIVTSGTATLETALFRVPQVVVYRAAATTYRFVKMIIRVPFISLVNLIAGKEVIRELIQGEANEEEVSREIERLLFEENYRTNVLQEYDQLISKLDTGSASENAARLMVGYLRA